MPQRLAVWNVNRQRGWIERDGYIALNRHQLLRQARRVRVLEQCLAWSLLGDLGGVIENCFERSELRDQLDRRLLADPAHARHVVGRVANERQEVDDAFRRHAKPITRIVNANPTLFHAGWTTTTWIQQPHARSHQLLKVLVARNDHHVVPGLDATCCERANHVVRFEARHRKNGDVIRGEQLRDPLEATIKVRLQLVRQLFTGRFVFRK